MLKSERERVHAVGNLLFEGAAQRTDNERLTRRVTFGATAGGENPASGRRENNQGCSRVMAGPAGRVRRRSNPRGSSPVRSRGVRNLDGWVGPGQEACNPNGSGPITLNRPDPWEATQPAKIPEHNWSQCLADDLKGASSHRGINGKLPLVVRSKDSF